MNVDQNELTSNPQSRRAFLTRLAVLGVGVAATMTLGVAEAEATSNTGIEDKPNDIAFDKEIAEGEKVQLAETVDPDVAYPVESGYSFPPFPTSGPVSDRHRKPKAWSANLGGQGFDSSSGGFKSAARAIVAVT